MKERALLVTVEFQSARRRTSLEDFAEELEELAVSAGLQVARSIRARQKAPSGALLVGAGKVGEIASIVTQEKIDVVVFGNDLSATQQRNTEEIVHAKTIDRTQLILDIFAQRAKSNEGKLQVELAQLNYLLPRLAGKGIALSRLGGGIGTRGPGEQKLEVDRRRIRERIGRLSRELGKLKGRRSQSIERKKEKEIPLVSLVGYTNAGKSTLFNALTRASVAVKDQLFSTLDTTTRLWTLPGNRKVFLADTVGFLRELPHHLIEAFKTTLEEARQADLLLHVVDSSRPDAALLMEAVDKVLGELRADPGKVLVVMNKIDLLKNSQPVIDLKVSPLDLVSISAKTGQGLETLCLRISAIVAKTRKRRSVFVPKEHLGAAHFLYEEGEVLERKDASQGAYFEVNLSDKAAKIFANKIQKSSLNGGQDCVTPKW